MPPKKLSIKAYASVKKNNAAKDPLITFGWMLVTNNNNATGKPPKVDKPFKVPDILPVKILANLLSSFLLEYPRINKIEKNIMLIQINRWVILEDKIFNK